MKVPEFLSEESAGSLRLAGHRIALEHVVYFYNQGYSPEMIFGQFPSLPLSLIHKVIAFYLENQAEVDEYVAQADEKTSQQRAASSGSPDVAELRRRAAKLRTSATT